MGIINQVLIGGYHLVGTDSFSPCAIVENLLWSQLLGTTSMVWLRYPTSSTSTLEKALPRCFLQTLIEGFSKAQILQTCRKINLRLSAWVDDTECSQLTRGFPDHHHGQRLEGHDVTGIQMQQVFPTTRNWNWGNRLSKNTLWHKMT